MEVGRCACLYPTALSIRPALICSLRFDPQWKKVKGSLCCNLGGNWIRRVPLHLLVHFGTLAPWSQRHACRQPVVSCFCHWRLSEDQNIEHYINSRVNCNSKLIINMKSKIQNQCLVKFSLMQVILTNFPHKILRCMSTSIDRLPTGVLTNQLELFESDRLKCNKTKMAPSTDLSVEEEGR